MSREKEYKNIKCRIGSILDRDRGDLIGGFIEQRCLAVSRMAARASLFCQLMVEMLLEKEEEWLDFLKVNIFTQIFTVGVNLKKIKQTYAR